LKAEELLMSFQIQYPGQAVYCYDLDRLGQRVNWLKKKLPANFSVHYAVKANHFSGLLQVFQKAGLDIDVVSGGELKLGLEVGFDPEQIVFSGIGKSKAELELAIEKSVKQINVESAPELHRIVDLAEKLKQRVSVALRVNPDVKAETHPYISTGLKENKFGLDFQTAKDICDAWAGSKRIQDHIDLVGFSLHIGSQIREVSPFTEAIGKTLELSDAVAAKVGRLRRIDIGGGLGMDYSSADEGKDLELFASYLDQIEPLVRNYDVLIEPGRFLSARFGALYAQVEYVKRTPEKNFLILNTGMHHLMRPMLYQAYHRIEAVGRSFSGRSENFDVVGPICESTDTLGFDRALPADLREGDWVAIYDTGAYGSVMQSSYNLQQPAAQVAIQNGRQV